MDCCLNWQPFCSPGFNIYPSNMSLGNYLSLTETVITTNGSCEHLAGGGFALLISFHMVPI